MRMTSINLLSRGGESRTLSRRQRPEDDDLLSKVHLRMISRCWIRRGVAQRTSRHDGFSHSSTRTLATLRVVGPDRRGIVAACTEVLNRHGCSIFKSEHYTDRTYELFFQRIVFGHCSNDESSEVRKRAIDEEMKAVHDQFGFLLSEVDWMERRKRVAVMVSKYDHCLWELLLRHRANELNCDIPIVLSNHETCQEVADTFKIPYTVIPKTAADKEEQEEKELRLLQSLGIDVVVLARYMQKLSHKFLQQFPSRIINIHHSFLPAFSGGRAYHQAHERGVKLIGATAHYATEDLDEGPIIEQDVIRVSHRDETRDFVRKGRMLERGVLVRALQAHLDNRVAVYGNKCVVFSD